MKREILYFDQEKDFIKASADSIFKLARNSIASRGIFTLVLSGGSTPRKLYELLATDVYKEKIEWNLVHLFWGDERMVSHSSPDSNFGMAYKAMISKLPIPRANVHAISVDDVSPTQSALQYEEVLGSFSLDLVLLGMGSDGHTASLFPSDPALQEIERWVIAVEDQQGKPPVPRVTLTLPAINSADSAMFLIAGTDKKRIADEIFRDPIKAAKKYPAARIAPKHELMWYIWNT